MKRNLSLDPMEALPGPFGPKNLKIDQNPKIPIILSKIPTTLFIREGYSRMLSVVLFWMTVDDARWMMDA